MQQGRDSLLGMSLLVCTDVDSFKWIFVSETSFEPRATAINVSGYWPPATAVIPATAG